MKNTPHDELFTQFMGYPETAKSFLSQYFPDGLLKRIDLDSFKDITQKIHDEKMRDYYTDLVFKTKVDEHDTYLCFLFEHKSYLDKNVALQILRYMTLIWEKAGKEDGDYPLILPIVFYQGEKEWNLGNSLKNIFHRMPDWMEKYIPYYEYYLFDFNKIKDKKPNDLRLQAYFNMLEAAWSHNKRQLIAEALKIADKISLEITYLDDFNILLQYITVTIDFSHDELISLVRNEIPERREDVMTIAEELREKGKREGLREGIKEGMKEGIKEGMKEGKREGIKEMVRTMLNNGMTMEQIVKLTNLEEEFVSFLKNEIKH